MPACLSLPLAEHLGCGQDVGAVSRASVPSGCSCQGPITLRSKSCLEFSEMDVLHSDQLVQSFCESVKSLETLAGL